VRTSYALGSRTSIDVVRVSKIIVHGEQDNIVLDGPGKKLELQYGTDLIQESLDGTDQSVHRADSVGRVLQTKDSKGNWVTREEITGGVDVAEHRIRNCVAKIIPASSGADALEFRTYDDKENFKITEDGYVKVFDGSTFQSAMRFNKATGNVEIARGVLTGPLNIQDYCWIRSVSVSRLEVRNRANTDFGDLAAMNIKASARVSAREFVGEYWTQDADPRLYVRKDYGVYIIGPPASSTSPLQDSWTFKLIGRYWDGTASRDRDAQIIHRMLSTTPTSEIAFQIAGSDKLCIGDTYVDAKGLLFKNARLSCASKGLTAVTVTETSPTLKQSVAPDSGFYGFAYIEGIRVTASNPTGSLVTLYFQVKALLDDGTEVSLSDVKSVAEGGSFDDWLRWIYDSVDNGRTIREVRLYAYCSATPATGYEPTVNLAKVTGVQV
jgi:hypothetical protein